MSRTARRLSFHRLAALGLLALVPAAAHAAPLRSYTVAELDAAAHPGAGLDNDGNVIDQPIRTIVGDVPKFHQGGSSGAWDDRLPGRYIGWAEVIDGTPDGRFMIPTYGAGSYPWRSISQTFVADPNSPYASGGWFARPLRHDDWMSIHGTDMNASGEIVGFLSRTDLDDGSLRYLWESSSFYAAAGELTVHELSELFPPGSGWSSVAALSINDNGQILGWGTNPEGEYAKFILTPNAVPEPGTWTVFGLMAAAAGWRARRGGRWLVTPSR